MTCGKGTVTGALRATDPNGLGPVPGVTLSAPGCTTAVSDARGYFNLTSDPSFVVRLDVSAPGYLHEHTEFQAKTTGFMGNGYLFESSITSKLPGWSSSQGYFFVIVGGTGTGTGPCSTGDGVVLSIKGHPEITALYWSDPLTPDSKLPSTGSLGLGSLGPVAPGTYDVVGTKTGCTSSGATNPHFAFENPSSTSVGALTLQEIQIQ